MELAQLQQMLTEAATLEQARRRQALEITFLQANAPPAAAAAGVDASATAAAAAADLASSSSEDDDDDDAAAVAGNGDGYEAGYSRDSRLRIQQAPADIAAQMGVPLARSVPGVQYITVVWHFVGMKLLLLEVDRYVVLRCLLML
jgi:hypothetical protein